MHTAPLAVVIAHCATMAGDADSLHEGHTTLAWELDVAMAIDDSARARYAAIYGREWAPNCDTYGSRHAGPTTTANTVQA